MRHFVVILLLAMLSFTAHGEAVNGQLEITVSNIQQAKGSIMVAIFNKPDNWLSSSAEKPPFRNAVYAVSNTENAKVIIEDLPVGSYAISIFHDLNENEKLDTNFVGFPKEPFAFSAPMGKFGPPKFEQAIFKVGQGSNQIEMSFN